MWVVSPTPQRGSADTRELSQWADRLWLLKSIRGPKGLVPNSTENFVSNEVIIDGLNAQDILPLLSLPAEMVESSRVCRCSKLGRICS